MWLVWALIGRLAEGLTQIDTDFTDKGGFPGWSVWICVASPVFLVLAGGRGSQEHWLDQLAVGKSGLWFLW